MKNNTSEPYVLSKRTLTKKILGHKLADLFIELNKDDPRSKILSPYLLTTFYTEKTLGSNPPWLKNKIFKYNFENIVKPSKEYNSTLIDNTLSIFAPYILNIDKQVFSEVYVLVNNVLTCPVELKGCVTTILTMMAICYQHEDYKQFHEELYLLIQEVKRRDKPKTEVGLHNYPCRERLLKVHGDNYPKNLEEYISDCNIDPSSLVPDIKFEYDGPAVKMKRIAEIKSNEIIEEFKDDPRTRIVSPYFLIIYNTFSDLYNDKLIIFKRSVLNIRYRVMKQNHTELLKHEKLKEFYSLLRPYIEAIDEKLLNSVSNLAGNLINEGYNEHAAIRDILAAIAIYYQHEDYKAHYEELYLLISEFRSPGYSRTKILTNDYPYRNKLINDAKSKEETNMTIVGFITPDSIEKPRSLKEPTERINRNDINLYIEEKISKKVEEKISELEESLNQSVLRTFGELSRDKDVNLKLVSVIEAQAKKLDMMEHKLYEVMANNNNKLYNVIEQLTRSITGHDKPSHPHAFNY